MEEVMTLNSQRNDGHINEYQRTYFVFRRHLVKDKRKEPHPDYGLHPPLNCIMQHPLRLRSTGNRSSQKPRNLPRATRHAAIVLASPDQLTHPHAFQQNCKKKRSYHQSHPPKSQRTGEKTSEIHRYRQMNQVSNNIPEFDGAETIRKP